MGTVFSMGRDAAGSDIVKIYGFILDADAFARLILGLLSLGGYKFCIEWVREVRVLCVCSQVAEHFTFLDEPII